VGRVTLYYIEKVGVYSHGVIGIYDTLDDAKAACERHTQTPQQFDDSDPHGYDVADDGDGYHSFHIMRTKLGGGISKLVAMWEGKRSCQYFDGKRVYSASYRWVIKEQQ
jgi:hypothetical protein